MARIERHRRRPGVFTESVVVSMIERPSFITPAPVLVVTLAFAACLPTVSAQSTQQLLNSTAAVRKMSEQELIELVPQQSGLQYVDCPNCDAGRQERQLTWSISKPDSVVCQFCGHSYPSEKYPMDQAVVVRTPRGDEARFPYWADAKGYRHFFQARRDDEVRRYLSRQAVDLARLYDATKDPAHARRAAIILDRFAQVFPGWCYHYDYPFQQKVIYDGDVSPAEFRGGFRTARWNWWAYHDIPVDLVEAYTLIRSSGALEELSKARGVNVAERIENDLLRNAGEQVLANRDEFTNMSPGAWREMVLLGRSLEESRYVHEPVRRLKQLMENRFFYDGFWCEGSPAYSKMTIGSLQNFLQAVEGYSDPPGVVEAIDRSRFDNLNLQRDLPELEQAQQAQDKLRFPDGRLVPVHDTWAYLQKSPPATTAKPYLLPALGHAALMGGTGPDRAEFHLSWSGGYGHQHADVLSLLLFANGRELLSDIGYTHTAYRSWTLATAAHNTVAIDGVSQEPGSKQSPTDGRLQFIDLSHPGIQVVQADGRRAYPGVASAYDRTLVMIDAGAGRRYAIDLFNVTGGKTHDYFLHGDADAPATAETSIDLSPRSSLASAGEKWVATKNEGESGKAYRGDYAYGFLQQLKSASVPAGDLLQVDFRMQDPGAPGIRATLIPEDASELVLGQNPSVRLAEEDDSQLEKFHRPFLMLRRSAAGRPSRFVTVLEPWATNPFIQSIQKLPSDGEAIVLQITLADRQDFLVLNAKQSQSVSLPGNQSASFRGDIGFLSYAGDRLSTAYALGSGGWKGNGWEVASPARQQAPLRAIEGSELIVDSTSKTIPKPGSVVRVTTADGWVYPYHVVSAKQGTAAGTLSITVQEGPGLKFDAVASQLNLVAFPRRQHQGDVFVDWLPTALKTF